MGDAEDSANFSLSTVEKKDREKKRPFRKRIQKLSAVVKKLENNLTDSHRDEKYMLTTIHNDAIQQQRLVAQLEEARKENKQLLNVLQQQHNDGDLSRSTSRSQIDIVSNYSTVSMVHLQYKYEELLSSHEGLLKVLEMRLKELQNSSSENDRLRDQIDGLQERTNRASEQLVELSEKYRKLRERKDRKINKLKFERNALREVHAKLLSILQEQQADVEKNLMEELRNAKEPIKALLVNEIRKNNLLEYENVQLRQELRLLASRCEEDARK